MRLIQPSRFPDVTRCCSARRLDDGAPPPCHMKSVARFTCNPSKNRNRNSVACLAPCGVHFSGPGRNRRLGGQIQTFVWAAGCQRSRSGIWGRPPRCLLCGCRPMQGMQRFNAGFRQYQFFTRENRFVLLEIKHPLQLGQGLSFWSRLGEGRIRFGCNDRLLRLRWCGCLRL